jgi:hypothetical protein
MTHDEQIAFGAFGLDRHLDDRCRSMPRSAALWRKFAPFDRHQNAAHARIG